MRKEGGGVGQHLLGSLQDYGKVPTYMQKRTREERKDLEDYCSRLQEESQEEMKRRLQKQQEALLVGKRRWQGC